MVRFVDSGGDADELAPVIPLFDPRRSEPPADRFVERLTPADRTSDRDPGRHPPADTESGQDAGRHTPADTESDRDAAEKVLLRKLAARALSVSEARDVLRRSGLTADVSQTLIDDFIRRGYLDDAALAEQVVHVAVDRRHDGRRAIGLALAKRGIGRDIADIAVSSLPDDDAERALDYARTKARSLSKLDEQVALRRLLGQLARRGYGGAAAIEAARTAVREAASSR